MKIFFQYCSFGFSNSYIIGDDNSSAENQKTAVIIDPGSVEKVTLETIENNNFNLKAVLITHDHTGHVQGLRTLKRIYNADVYAVNPVVMGHKTKMVKDGDKLDIAPFSIEVISIPGHSSDSVVYRIGTMLFSGDVLTAGLVGNTASAYGAATQMNRLRSRLLSLPGDYFVLPGHGPPSTLEAERRFNTDIFHFDQTQTRRPSFYMDI